MLEFSIVPESWIFAVCFVCLGDDEVKDDTTLVFELKVKCIKNKNAPKDATDPDELYINSKGLALDQFHAQILLMSFKIRLRRAWDKEWTSLSL